MGKGQATRATIMQEALAVASQVGIEGLTIGVLAERLGLSKSGLFAHFGSREALQVAGIQAGQDEVVELAVRPALQAPRGLPRIRSLFDHWLARHDVPGRSGGCPLLGATAEFDDRPGAVRDQLARGQRDLRQLLINLVQYAQDTGELRRERSAQDLAFELFGFIAAAHHDLRLLDDAAAPARARAAMEYLLASHRAPGLESADDTDGRR